ncbi:MAG: QueT transporter family protein [bacterium]
MKINKLTLSGLVIALYIVIMYFTQGFAFLQYQIRIATALYALAYLYPFLMIPLAIANGLSNLLMGGLGILDVLGGFGVGLITTFLIVLIRRYKFNYKLVFIPILLVGVIVPLWLNLILNLPYLPLAINVSLGQIIPAILGVILIRRLK